MAKLKCQRPHILFSPLIKREFSLLLLPLSKFIPSSFFSSKAPTPTPTKSLQKEETLLSIFKKCYTTREVEQVHSQIIQTGLHQNLYLIGKIIAFCAISHRGSMDYAASVFQYIEKPDGFLWNTMIRGFVRTMQEDQVFEYFKKMQENGESPDNFTFSFVIKISGQMRSVLLGKQLHCNALKHGLEDHVFVRNTLIHMYGMFKDVATARQLFDEIPQPDLVAWNTIIDCHVNSGNHKEAIKLFLRMGTEPDVATITVILSACSALGALDFGRLVHSCIANTRMSNFVSVSNSLIDMYSKCGAVEEAHKIFTKMNNKDLVTWNSMIVGLATHGHANAALDMFSSMLDEGLEKPNDVTFLGVLCACSHGGKVEEGRKYFHLMQRKYRIEPTIKHYGCLVDILGRAGFVGEAYGVIRSMPMKCNAIVWRTLLAACRVHGNVELGEVVRKHLLELEPDYSSDYVLLANTYAAAGQWKDVMRERKSMRDRGVQKPMPGNSYIGVPRMCTDQLGQPTAFSTV